MDATVKTVAEALEAWVGPKGAVRIEIRPTGKIGGTIVHPDFRGLAFETRQRWIWRGVPDPGPLDWKGLNAVFGPEAVKIGVIFADSPEEDAARQAEQAQVA